MKIIVKNITAALIVCLLTSTAMAGDINFVSAYDYINGFEKVVLQANKHTHIMVEIPGVIPKPTAQQKYYVSYEKSRSESGLEYMIYVDSTPTCQGAKFCNIGTFSARKGEQIDKMKDKNNKEITVPVMLADGIDAYYTPGHAMGDYFPASIQWLDNKSVYTITWNAGKETEENIRASLITMANSAKHPGSG